MKKLFFAVAFLILSCLILVNYNLYQQNQKNIIESDKCQKNNAVAQSNFFISFPEYDIKTYKNGTINLIRNGKAIKTYKWENKFDDYISFENNNIMITDTIEIEIKDDIYLIHKFKNQYFINSKHHDCSLSSYKINNFLIDKNRTEEIILSKKYLK